MSKNIRAALYGLGAATAVFLTAPLWYPIALGLSYLGFLFFSHPFYSIPAISAATGFWYGLYESKRY